MLCESHRPKLASLADRPLADTVSFTNTVAPPGWTMQGRRNDPAARGAAVDGPFYDVTYQPGGATLIVGSTGALDLGIVATDSWMPPRAPDDFPLIAEIDAVLDVGHAPFRDQPQAQFGWVFAGQGQDQCVMLPFSASSDASRRYCPISGLCVLAFVALENALMP